MSGPETRLQRRVRTALEAEHGGYWYKVHGSRYQPSGLPDLSGVVRGRSCWVEVKTPDDGELSTIQIVRMVELMDAGAAVCVATSPAEAVTMIAILRSQPRHRFCFGCLFPRSHYVAWTESTKARRCAECGRVDR